MSFEQLDQNPLENEKIGIENAKSFEELYKLIRQMGEIKGTRTVYAAEEIISDIEQVRHDILAVGYVTRSHGLRGTVERLLKDDEVYQKSTGKPATPGE